MSECAFCLYTACLLSTTHGQGSDHGFFDTAGEDGGNFSDELDGTGGGSEEGFHPLEHNSQPLEHAPQARHTQLCLPNGVCFELFFIASLVAYLL